MKIEHKTKDWVTYKDKWEEISLEQYIKQRIQEDESDEGDLEKMRGQILQLQNLVSILTANLIKSNSFGMSELKDFLGSDYEGKYKIDGKNLRGY